MIGKNTVLILGAGASVDYGFPLGRDLITCICEQLSDEDSTLYSLLTQCGFNSNLIRKFAVPLKECNLPSIDAFLENRPEFEEVGKAAIAGTLIPLEKKSNLSRKGWYEYLHSKLIGKKDQFRNNKLSVITFNYDRSFEYSLFKAVRSAYGLSDKECKAYLNTIPVIHVYGKLGDPAYLSEKYGRPYRPDLSDDIISKCVKAIKVIHEKETEELKQARELLKKAEIICCLGFGYHPENVGRLQLPNVFTKTEQEEISLPKGQSGQVVRSTFTKTSWPVTVFLSAYGFTDKETDRLLKKLYPLGKPGKKYVFGRTLLNIGKKNQEVLTFLRENAVFD